MIDGTPDSKQDMKSCLSLRTFERYIACEPAPTLAHTVSLGKPLEIRELL